MQIIDLDKENPKLNIDSITLGNFDGFHIAHQKLIEKCVNIGKSAVIIFKTHTTQSLKDNNFKYILSTQDKINILSKFKVNYCLLKSFDAKFLSLTPDEFLQYLKKITNFKNLVVGKDFKFGVDATGNVELLKSYSDIYNFKLFILNDQFIKEMPIRSTKIRELLSEGLINKANSMLYRPYSIKGKIVNGKHRGRTLGYPTANLKCENYFIPSFGVYYTNVIYNNKLYKGITSIGENLTYNEKEVKIETHILDFSGNLYNQEIILVFISKIRDNIKFDNEKELITSLEKDYNFAKKQNLHLQLNDYMVI
ncbi:bifunctional riboflavin kinase/FAD synthetase [uncultured Finegoldia sp.]|uniref:bifunctional riboflavin kinase/FAD synthetase n=1 Tax=uncultured Finegoldia sp. TaxID=328009 RepID=UPI0026125A94|nr:bifunctional riboflavin kinase/FAD synthetase [uncultured Finegoldia sp.]